MLESQGSLNQLLWGQMWCNIHAPKGSGSQCSVYTIPGISWEEARGGPFQEADSRKALNGMLWK